jgi:hypothetical protein
MNETYGAAIKATPTEVLTRVHRTLIEDVSTHDTPNPDDLTFCFALSKEINSRVTFLGSIAENVSLPVYSDWKTMMRTLKIYDNFRSDWHDVVAYNERLQGIDRLKTVENWTLRQITTRQPCGLTPKAREKFTNYRRFAYPGHYYAVVMYLVGNQIDPTETPTTPEPTTEPISKRFPNTDLAHNYAPGAGENEYDPADYAPIECYDEVTA